MQAEDLLPVAGVVDGDVGEDGGPVEEALEGPTGADGRALRHAGRDQAVHAVALAGVDERAERHLLAVGVADRQVRDLLGQDRRVLLGD